MSEKAVEYLSKQIENINNKLKEISDDIHCVDIEINTINDKIILIDNNTDKTEDMFISFGNEVFERNQNELLKSKIDDLLKQKEIYQENYNQLSVKMEEMQDVINNNDIETMENVDNNSDSTNILWLLEADRKRISRDIHDTVVQNLTALIHKQEFAIQIADRDLNRAKIEMNNVKGIVKESINELRNIIYQLRPMELDDLGFNEALMNLLDKLDDSHKDIIMHYTIDCTDDISHVVCMSTLRIINELTSNSFKHADCNNIYIDIATDDNKLTISYKDDGCGFDFEQIGKVKSNNTGYGIRMLVERVNLLRGSINYNKDEKEFVIEIIIFEERENNMSVNILLADDHKMIREGLKQLLEMYDDIKVVGEAGDGFECLNLADKTHPDVILLDINMPNLDGLQVLNIIKTQKMDCKVIVLTIHNEIEYLIKAIDFNCDGYILKDSDFDTLKNAIMTVYEGQTYIEPTLVPLLNVRLAERDLMKDKSKELTRREVEVLKMIASGSSNKEIASTLSISERTVKNHVSNIFKKINVSDRTQAAVFAIKNDIIKLK